MNVKILALAFAITVIPAIAYAETANWTGNSRSYMSSDGRQRIACEYYYSGGNFWRYFDGYTCPQTVQRRTESGF